MLGIRGWVTHFTAHPSARSVPITHILAVLAFTLFAGAIDAAAEAKAPPEAPLREQLTLPTESAMKPWTGDLDGMIDRQIIRVLTVYSKTF